jgi:hypothetical protein
VRCVSVEALVEAYLAQDPPAGSTPDGQDDTRRDATGLTALINDFVESGM